MPINAMRMAAMQQVQDTNQVSQGLDEALSTGAAATPSLDFGQQQAIAQPLAQASAITNYVPQRTELKPVEQTPAQDAQSTDNSLTAYLQQQAGQNVIRADQGVYSETMSNSIGNSLDVSARVGSQLQQLGGKSPEERAQIGGQYGMGLGAAIGNGPMGALIGSSVGAMTSRALGYVQSGEQDAARRRQGIAQVMGAAGALAEGGRSPFEGSTYVASDQARYPNISGRGDRGAFEIDMSNPLSRRSTTVARPLARYITQGMMNQLDDDGGPISRSTDQTTGMLVNMLTDGVNNIDSVYGRAKDISARMGITQEGIRSFYSANRHRIPAREAKEIKQGLDTIYGS